MKFFAKKKNTQKIVISFIFLILFNFIVPTYSRADVGGVLSAPVVALVATIFDAINGLMANFMVGGEEGFVKNILTVYPMNGTGTADDYINNNPMDDQLPTVVILADDLIGEYGIPILKYTPALIFSGKVEALSVNFFTNEDLDVNTHEKSIVAHLRGIVSSWYVALRNVAVVGLLSVLIYLGIRLIITSSNPEKAKYKQSILDWVVAMCLVFFLHYIMSFTMVMVDAITDMIRSDNLNGNEINVAVFAKGVDYNDAHDAYDNRESAETKFSTSLMGAARIQVEYENGAKKWGYLVLYIALTIYTIMFTITYIKRVINMVFLTVMAPLVALTYPIDKAGDSKAQAFSFWLKEYIYNALLQPIHLLLYTVLVSSALSLAATNMLYAIVALAFILPAEKILKQMFNFRNSATGSSLGGFAGGMVAKGMLDRVAKGGKSAKQTANNKVRTANMPLPKDPDAPKGASALAGSGTLLAGAPILSAARNAEGGTENQAGSGAFGGTLDSSDNGSGSNGILPGVELNGGQSLEEPGNGMDANTTEIVRQQQDILNDPNATEQEKAQAQEEIDYYQGRQMAARTSNTAGALATGTPATGTPAVTPVRQAASAQRLGRGGVIGGIKNVGQKMYKRAGGLPGITKSVARGALRAGSIAGATAIGVGAGIVSDDLDNIVKWGLGGAYAGSAIGSNMANRVEGLTSGISQTASTIANDFIEGSGSSDDVARRRLDRQEKEFKKNYETRQYFRENFSDKTETQIDGIMDRAAKYNRGGLKDLDRIKDAIKLEDKLLENIEPERRDEFRDQAHNEALTMAKIRSDLGENGFSDSKRVESRKTALKDQLKNNGMSEADAQARADQTFNFMSQTLNT